MEYESMPRNLIAVIYLLTLTHIAYAQEHADWAFTYLNYYKSGDNSVSNQICSGVEKKHRVVVSDTYGKEYYCSGNLHAEGSLKSYKSVTVIEADTEHEYLQTEYLRDGFWKVYYDSSIKILRSEGKYESGQQVGKWVIYYPNGKPKYLFEFSSGQTKTKIHIDENGNQELIIRRSEFNVLVEKFKILLILLTVIRISYNIITYNQINDTKYIPFLQNWQKGGRDVNLYCTFTFWWLFHESDTPRIRSYKSTANWISILSVIWFGLMAIIFTLYGEK
ncbi:MAG: hypothetical protein EOO43_02855 [Flavobacterium sp.]|nr:MAG: hypothetical protein EOO43_02855 [Flavobacterium sp.]